LLSLAALRLHWHGWEMDVALPTTAERAAALAEAASRFPLLGEIRAADLLASVALELGHAEILDGFRPYAGHLARALAPETILHIVSGNTPHAALQSLIRGLLLGSHNRVKLPSAGLPEVEFFVRALPPALATRVELATELPESWLQKAKAIVVFGSDATIAHFRGHAPAGVPFQAHGHRVSLGIVFDDPDFTSVEAAARDVSLYDQQGCLSPHDLYVADDARAYAERLASAMEAFNRHTPHGAISMGERAALADLRASVAFRAASGESVAIWQSADSTDWTVIYEEEPGFTASPLNRIVFVKPLPTDLATALAPVRQWLGAIGIWPATKSNAERIARLGASRICPLGRMQFPPATWHAEGLPNLANLVSWVDFEPAS
jgi:hypothetical protein